MMIQGSMTPENIVTKSPNMLFFRFTMSLITYYIYII